MADEQDGRNAKGNGSLMGAAEKVVAIKTTVPDTSKPVPMYYWALPNGQTFGNGTQRIAMTGGEFRDGEMTSGKIMEIVRLSDGGIRIEVQPMQLSPVDQMPPRKHVFIQGLGHGSALSEQQAEEFAKTGRISRP